METAPVSPPVEAENKWMEQLHNNHCTYRHESR